MSSHGETARRNLVIVRAGPSSLHPGWLHPDRTWDLIVSTYDAAARFDHGDDVPVILEPGGKWDGIFRLLSTTDVLDRYDFFWLPDDDIATTAADIDRIFAAMGTFALDVAQPALTLDSYYTHFLFNACPAFALRYTNFVEIMVPCLCRDALRRVYSDFRDTMSGFGLDYVWCRLGPETDRRSAIIDTVAVRHTRPIGHSLRKSMAHRGLTPQDEEERLKRRYGIAARARPLVYSAIDRRGRMISGKRRIGLLMASSYLRALMRFSDSRLALEKIVQMLRRQFVRPIDLTPLKPGGPA